MTDKRRSRRASSRTTTVTMLFVMTGACATSGGIAAHNRQILRALGQLAAERRACLTVFSFLEADTDRPPFLPASAQFQGFSGDKIRLILGLLTRALARPTLIFDHVTLALPLLPFIRIAWTRSIIFAHGSESWRRVRRTSRWLFSSATLVLTNSHFTLRKMGQRGVRGNVVPCPLGLAPEFELNAAPEPPGPLPSLVNASGSTRQLGSRVCLLVGRMHPQEREKGHYELLQVWPEIIREFPAAQLVFAGPGDDRENIAQLARERGVGDSVFVPGTVSPETLRQLYAGCYAFTMPSKQEGFGLVYLEAMNAAKPCLGCWDDGAEDVIVHEETGLLVRDPRDASELGAALGRLLSDPGEAREMGKRGFDRLHAHFTAAHVQQRLHEQLTKVI